ncbi:MAG TPA: YggT family protein [Spirochaetota bacterium]|nr:YggT family protein [Spirochaetota bacterium]
MSISVIISNVIVYSINIFLLILTIRIFLSWLVLPPSRPIFYLYKITDPILNFARKYFPLRLGILDLSIVFPFLFLNLISKFVTDILVMGRPLTLFYLLGLLLFSIDSILNVVLFALILFCVIMLIMNFIAPYSYNPLLTAIKSIITPLLMIMRRTIRINSKYSDVIYLAILIILLIIIGFFMHGFFYWLIRIVNQIDIKSFISPDILR